MKAYSLDLRERVMRSIKNGRQQTWVARELGIGLGMVKRYIKREATTGSLAAKQQQRERPKIGDEELAALQAQVDAHPDAIDEHIAYWQATHEVQVGRATMCRALQRANRPLKKTIQAQERHEGERVLFKDLASTLDITHVVMLDESGSKLGIIPAYARAPAGERANSRNPFNHGRHYTL